MWKHLLFGFAQTRDFMLYACWFDVESPFGYTHLCKISLSRDQRLSLSISLAWDIWEQLGKNAAILRTKGESSYGRDAESDLHGRHVRVIARVHHLQLGLYSGDGENER